MAMWDPEAAGNAAQYLRLGDIELLDVRNAPFEGKWELKYNFMDFSLLCYKRLN